MENLKGTNNTDEELKVLELFRRYWCLFKST